MSPGTLGTKAHRPPPKGGRVGLKTQEPRLLTRAHAWAKAQALSQNGNAISCGSWVPGTWEPSTRPYGPVQAFGETALWTPFPAETPNNIHWIHWIPMNPMSP